MYSFKLLTIVFTAILIQFILSTCNAQATTTLKNEVCGQPNSANGIGLITCTAYIPSWSYDVSKQECVQFVYGGCGGNDNRFASHAECQQKCV